MSKGKRNYLKRKRAITHMIDSAALKDKSISYIMYGEGKALERITKMHKLNPDLLHQHNKSINNLMEVVAKMDTETNAKLNLFESQF